METQEITRKLFTVDDVYAMFEAGILDQDARVELLEGEIFEVPAPGPRHVACVNRATMLLAPALSGRAIVSVQNPLRLNRRSEPLPDIVLVKHRADFYSSERFLPPDTLLVIEVSDSSLYHDLHRKLPLYAKAEVQEVWIEDVQAGIIHVYRDRDGMTYLTALTLRRGESISLAAFPDLILNVDDLLGVEDQQAPATTP
jgi:Uma2 family endonuclease